MFLRILYVERVSATGEAWAVPLRQLDSFAMRNFTNDAAFDDTLPVNDGTLEVGLLVPITALRDAMTQWFRRKGYLGPNEVLRITGSDDART